MLRKTAAILIALTVAAPALTSDRETKVRQDPAKVDAAGDWIYNDLDRGIEEAKATGKPLLVVIRCIP